LALNKQHQKKNTMGREGNWGGKWGHPTNMGACAKRNQVSAPCRLKGQMEKKGFSPNPKERGGGTEEGEKKNDGENKNGGLVGSAITKKKRWEKRVGPRA